MYIVPKKKKSTTAGFTPSSPETCINGSFECNHVLFGVYGALSGVQKALASGCSPLLGVYEAFLGVYGALLGVCSQRQRVR